jgi:hypothetical protein
MYTEVAKEVVSQPCLSQEASFVIVSSLQNLFEMHFKGGVWIDLGQRCQTQGPRSESGPLTHFMLPAVASNEFENRTKMQKSSATHL